MSDRSICMRSRLSQRDCYYGGGLVNGARNITLMGDCANRLMAKEFGNLGRFIGSEKVRMFEPCFAGDYMEYYARVLKEEGKDITIETRCFKVGKLSDNALSDSSADILETPPLVMAMICTYRLP